MKGYSYDEAVVNIEKPGGLNLAIFDVSPTIECRWIAIGNNNAYLLHVFESTREMLKFVAHAQNKGATVFDEGFLDDEASKEGFDRWAEYVADECGEYETPS